MHIARVLTSAIILVACAPKSAETEGDSSSSATGTDGADATSASVTDTDLGSPKTTSGASDDAGTSPDTGASTDAGTSTGASTGADATISTSTLEPPEATTSAGETEACPIEGSGEEESCQLRNACGDTVQEYVCDTVTCTCVEDGVSGTQCPAQDFCGNGWSTEAVTACCGWVW